MWKFYRDVIQELSLEQRYTQELARNILERMGVEQRRKNIDKPVRKFRPPDFSAVKKRKPAGEESLSKSFSKENTLADKERSVQALKSTQQQNEKVIDLLMKEKRMMEREISILKSRLRQEKTHRTSDDIGLHQDDNKVDRARNRPSSAPLRNRERLNGSSVSLELQADIDRYIRKRRELEEQEHKARVEQTKYEEELKRRSMRASLEGHEFTGLMERQRESEKLKAIRQARRLQQAKAAASRERREYELQKKVRSERPPSSGLSWREIEEQEEEKRKQRVESRKQSLLAMSVPFRAAEPLPPRKQITEDPSESFVFKAKDPQEVVNRLSLQQESWKQRLEAIKQRNKSENASKKIEKTPIEKRAEEYALKRRERKKLRLDKERAEEKLQKEKEEERRKRLLGTKIPDASKRLTRSVELKIGEVSNTTTSIVIR